jgi:hypothetical protein
MLRNLTMQELPLADFVIGSQLSNSTFLQLSSRRPIRFHECVLHLNVYHRQLELHFNLEYQDFQLGLYKIILPLRYLTPDSYAINRVKPESPLHSIFLDLSIAPQVWRKSEYVDEQDLQDRLLWSDHEQWIRQAEIGADFGLIPDLEHLDTRVIMKEVFLPTGMYFPSVSLTIGRWRSYQLLVLADTPEIEIEMHELLEILKYFNININDRPVHVVADAGDALGVAIEDELYGLSNTVRYSFDVCLAHGYL